MAGPPARGVRARGRCRGRVRSKVMGEVGRRSRDRRRRRVTRGGRQRQSGSRLEDRECRIRPFPEGVGILRIGGPG